MIERAARVESAGRKERSIVIDCNVPPSVNRLWRVGKNKKVYRDPRYMRWLREFWARWYVSRPRGYKPIETQFDAEILICPSRKRDADASAKAVLDACQSAGIIANDSQARKVTQELVDKDRAPMGCRLRIIPIES